MYLLLTLLILTVHSVHCQHSSDYTRNSVYYAGQILPTVPTTEQTSQDVLKELGVDLSNEGKIFTSHLSNTVMFFSEMNLCLYFVTAE